jgi:hypothetical protein
MHRQPQQRQRTGPGYGPRPAVPGGHFPNFPNMHSARNGVPNNEQGSLGNTGYPPYHYYLDHGLFYPA